MTKPTTLEQLREKLAEIEHERWADWQRWMHTKFVEHSDGKGKFVCLPTEIFSAWQRQLETDYADLSDREKASDMEQVDRYWPLILDLIQQREQEARIDENNYWLGVVGNDVPHICFEDFEDRIAELEKELK